MKENAEIKTEQVAREIANLRTLSARSLRNKWQELYGTKAPRCARPSLMVRAIAYKVQENAFGGLKPSVRRLLEKGANDALAGRPIKIQPRPKVREGTVLVREWHGTTHQVTLTDGAVRYRGRSYSSLSEVARIITGCRWSGPRFFGLKSNGKERADGGQ